MSDPAVEPEDQARADVYALLARLFYAPPDEALLRQLATTGSPAGEDEATPFTHAWNSLAHAAAVVESEVLREEFEALFVGTGKSLVTPYASAYLEGAAQRAPLVGIRATLATHGLARISGRHEPEDHIAALCETMRHLALHGELDAQKETFERYVWPAAGGLCDAINRCERAGFYRHVAQLMLAFAELEHESFQMD